MKKSINLILLPGMDGTSLLLLPFVTELKQLYSEVNCICIEYPSNALMDYQQLAEYVRQKIPANESYILLGESFSGPVAVLVASIAMQMLKGIILVVTFVRNPKPVFSNIGSLLPSLELSTSTMTHYFMPVISKLLLGSYANAKFKKALKNAIDQVPLATLRYRLQQVLLVDVASELSNIHVPMMYIFAKQDALVKHHAYDVIKDCKPNLALVELEGPHMVLQVRPKEAAAHVQRFINTCI